MSGMNCPNCRKTLTVEHLRVKPECSRVMASAVGLYSLSKRKTPPKAGPGRPKKAKETEKGSAAARGRKSFEISQAKIRGHHAELPLPLLWRLACWPLTHQTERKG